MVDGCVILKFNHLAVKRSDLRKVIKFLLCLKLSGFPALLELVDILRSGSAASADDLCWPSLGML